MGQFLSSGDRVPTDDAAFVVPTSLNLSASQMSIIMTAGQRPGVPFRMEVEDNTNVKPTRRFQDHLLFSNSSIAIDPKSISLVGDGAPSGKIAVKFRYSAIGPCNCVIFIGGRDYSSTVELRVENSRSAIGPVPLPSGTNIEWSSHGVLEYFEAAHLPCLTREYSSSRHADIIVVLSNLGIPSPTAGRGIIPSNSDNYRESSKVRFGWSLNPGVVHVTLKEANPTTSKRTFHIASEMTCTRLSSTNQPYVLAAFNVASRKLAISVPSSADISSRSKTFPLVVQEQKVQSKTGGVYSVQGLFGLNNGSVGTAYGNHDSGADTGRPAEPTSATAGEGDSRADLEVDTDSSECVICLTDPRIVVVYPCRHVCMCLSCAQSMPAQNNKCPMCRRVAKLLLVLPEQSQARETN